MAAGLSSRDLSSLIFRRRKVFFGFLGVTVLLYFVFVFQRTKQFESFTSVMVKIIDSDEELPVRAAMQGGTPSFIQAHMATSIINSTQVILTSQDVLDTTLKQVGVERVYPHLKAKAAATKRPLIRLAAEELLSDLSIDLGDGTHVLFITLFNHDPEIARETLNALLTATVNKHSSITRNPRLPFLEAKLVEMKAEVDAAQRAMLDFSQRTGITLFDEERTLLLERRDATETTRNKIQSDLFAEDGRSRSLQEILQRTPRQVMETNENDRNQNQVDSALTRLTAAQKRFLTAKQRFVEGSPELLDQQAQLDAARKNFDEVNAQDNTRVRMGANPVALTLDQDIANAKAYADSQRGALEERQKQLLEIDERLAYLASQEGTARMLARRLEMAEASYRAYLVRAQSARMVRDMNAAGISSLSVLQAPTLPIKPSRPKRTLLLLLTLFAGLAAGLSVCLFLDLLDDTLTEPDEVEEALDLPLLAVVNHQGPSRRSP